MSIKKNQRDDLEKDTHEKFKIARIGSLVILIVILGVGAAAYFSGQKQASSKQSPIPIVDVSKLNREQVLGTAIFSWSGTLRSIDQTKLTISTQLKNTEGKYESRDIAILTSSGTQFTRWDLTKPASGTEQSPQQKISLTDLKPGQQVIVRANSDLNAQAEVTAASVTSLVTP